MLGYVAFFAIASGPWLAAAGQQDANPQSPVTRRVAAAQQRVAAQPKSPQAYNELAFAYCRWARDTGDVKLYDSADNALQRSFQLSPANYEAQKLEVTVLLGRRDFAKALKLATELNHKVPDDIAGWGLVVDSRLALGNEKEAERAAQWILDLRPGSSLGFVKAAEVREQIGDLEGAIQFYEEAARRTAQTDFDERAWLLNQQARLVLKSGNAKRAEELFGQALKLFPDSQSVRTNLALLHR